MRARGAPTRRGPRRRAGKGRLRARAGAGGGGEGGGPPAELRAAATHFAVPTAAVALAGPVMRQGRAQPRRGARALLEAACASVPTDLSSPFRVLQSALAAPMALAA